MLHTATKQTHRPGQHLWMMMRAPKETRTQKVRPKSCGWGKPASGERQQESQSSCLGEQTCQSLCGPDDGFCEERALRRAQIGRDTPSLSRPRTVRPAPYRDSPGWLWPIALWGRPSNQEIFRGLSTRPTSFLDSQLLSNTTASPSPIIPVSYTVVLSTPTERTRTSPLILQAKVEQPSCNGVLKL